MTSFAAIPPYVEGLFAGTGDLPGLPAAADRVVVILLDALGRVFLERFADHPLLRRLDAVCPLNTQFPSQTTAHITTMHTGLPVGGHGLYEWNVYDPQLDRVITPMRFSYAGDAQADTLPLDPRDLIPASPTLYERLAAAGVVPLVYQPSRFSPSTYDRGVIRGADLRPYGELADAVRDACRAVAALERGYAYVYFDAIDTTGHVCGPSSPAFAETVRNALDAVEAGLLAASDTLVLLTADHGQVDVDPSQTLWLDELHPPLARLGLRPAGSARDVFLHVDDVDATVAALAPHTEVHAVADLLRDGAFGDGVTARLTDRLGSVCVLPPPGRMAWLRGAADFALSFRGHHGGRTAEESQTYLAALAT